MNGPSPIPLLRVSHLRSFIRAMDMVGLPCEQLLKEARLPVLIQDEPDLFVAERFVWNLSAHAARRAGMEDFGSHVARLSPIWKSEPAVIAAMVLMPTLRSGLQQFCQLAKHVSTGPGYRLQRIDGAWVFCHLNWPGVDDHGQIDLYTLALMTQVVQCVSRTEWQPSKVYVRRSNVRLVVASEQFCGCHVRPSNEFTGIVVPDEDLAQGMDASSALVRAQSLPSPIALNLLDAMRLALRSYMKDGRPGVELAAEIAGVSERTFQRRLQAFNLNYTGLLDQVRFEEARGRLHAGDSNITEIAFDLGFTDVAHFTRAFRRWSGMAPSEFRRRRDRSSAGVTELAHALA